MRGKCSKCDDQELIRQPSEVFRMALPWLNGLVHIETHFVCSSCGNNVKTQVQTLNHPNLRASLRGGVGSTPVETNHVMWEGLPSLSTNGVVRNHDRAFIPITEGNIQDGTVIDQYGDSDLMAEMAGEYLRQFWALVPARPVAQKSEGDNAIASSACDLRRASIEIFLDPNREANARTLVE